LGWFYEEEVRFHTTRQEIAEDGKRYVPFGNDLQLKEVIAGASFADSRTLIENALKDHSGPVKVVKATRSVERFEIVLDQLGFRC
jgi:hypothetical protein